MKNLIRSLVLLFLSCCSLSALSFRGVPVNAGLFKSIKAESWSIVGQNIIVKGGIHIPVNGIDIYADKAVINIENKDIEAVGNVRFMRWSNGSRTLTPDKLAELQRKPNTLTEIQSVSGDVWGRQKVSVKVTALADNIQAERLTGNLSSGYFRFDQVQIKYATFVCRAKSAERRPDGLVEAKDAELSSCVYLEHNNAHYSVGATTIKLMPRETEFFGTDSVVTDSGDHSVLLFNGIGKVYGVPVMWFPVFYKPRDISLGLFSIQAGKTGDWGYYLAMSKYFPLTDYPRSGFRLHGDYYEKRGFGYGLRGDIVSEQSRTDFFAYSIHDRDPFETDDYNQYRLKVPHDRFDFRVSNITHITPRLDFRGVFEYASDLYFIRDFFSRRFSANPQPATYAALEQQFDHFSASVYYRPRVNTFYTVSERLPEVRIDIPRQQIFNTNFYYQGDLDSSLNRMKWIDFDYDQINGKPLKNKLVDYQAYRFDTTHFLYFPIRTDWLTFIPRAGFKFTAYSNSSDHRVRTNDLLRLFIAANPECVTKYQLNNYDRDGGALVRALGELGFEASTKLHNTWNDVRVPLLKLDGLRHVMRPYVNYTYIGDPGKKRDYLFYFDDTDRIETQNFFRFGLENRLQTRNSDKTIRNYLSMENYWDLYLEKAKGIGDVEEFNRVGNFCTTLTMSPIERLTFRTSFGIDLGNNNGEAPEAIRRGRNAGHPGVNAKWLNRWNASITYEPIDDVHLNLSYVYNRPYSTRSSYSMGSTLYQLDAGGFFDKFFEDYDEYISAGISLPITPDRRTKGAFRCTYDITDGSFSSLSLMVTRTFHCWELIATVSLSRDADDEDHEWDPGFSVQARLLGLESPLQQKGNDMAAKAAEAFKSGNTDNQWGW